MPRAHINGVGLTYDLQGAGTPLVLIHGAQGDRSMFARLAPIFAQHFHVLTFDQRGSGESEKPDMAYSIAMLADDTAALMGHVGFVSAHIIGVSMGGMIAQEFALRHPQKIRSLVLGCTTPGGPNAVPLGGGPLARAYSTQPMSAEERGRALAEACFTKGYIDNHPEIIPAMIEARRQRPIEPTALGHRMKAAHAHNTYDRLPHIAAPTLVIAGKDDVLISWENSRILAERIPGAKCVILEPAGHIFWTEQAERSQQEILTFLQTH
ncbi:MAG: alpha/beta fold hydrolase [Candidatus Binatia bacterium]